MAADPALPRTPSSRSTAASPCWRRWTTPRCGSTRSILAEDAARRAGAGDPRRRPRAGGAGAAGQRAPGEGARGQRAARPGRARRRRRAADGAGRRVPRPDSADGPARVLVLDRLTNPANVGMILRSATAAGLDGVLLPRRGLPAIDPLVVKASAGVAFRAPVLRAATVEEGCAALRDGRVRGLRAGRGRVVAAHGGAARAGRAGAGERDERPVRRRCGRCWPGCWRSPCTPGWSRWAWRARARWPRSSWPAAPADGESPFSGRRVAVLARRVSVPHGERPRAVARQRGGWQPRVRAATAGRIGLRCEDGPASPAPALRARPAAAARPVRPGRHRPAAAPRRLRRGPAADRPAAHAARGVRLLRRRRRRRAVAPPRPGGVRPGRVPPVGAARRVDGRHQPRHPRQARRPPVRVRPHRLHPDDAHRGRAGGGVGRAGDRRPLHAVDDGHHDHRGPRRLRPRRPAVVPALPVARPVVRQGPRPTRRRGGLRHAHAHRGHPVRRGAPARRPQRPRRSRPRSRSGRSSTARMHPNWWFDLLTTEPLTFATPRGRAAPRRR